MNAFARYFLVGLLATGMIVDAAAARRLFQRRCCRAKCETSCVATCPAPCESIACEPDPCVQPCADIAPPMVEPDSHDDDIQPQTADQVEPLTLPSPTPEVTSDPEPALETPAQPPAHVGVPTDVETTQPTPIEPMPIEPMNVEPMNVEPAPVEPVPTESTPVEPMPADPAPSESPTADVVGDRYADPTDDVFGPSAAEQAPVEAPTPAAPTPATEDTAGDVDDIFGDPTPTVEDMPPADTAQADTAPADEPMTESDDTASEASEPDTTVDDLFGPSTTSEEDEEEEPATPPAEATEPSEPAEPSETTNTESDDTSADEPAETEESWDPFGEDDLGVNLQRSILNSNGGLFSKANRTWTDDTASFRCEARLLRVTAKKVVLQKPSGAKLSVPFARLANSDLRFVQQQITALRIVRARDAAAEKLAVTWRD